MRQSKREGNFQPLAKKIQENRKTPHRKSKEKSKKHIVEGCQRENDKKKVFFAIIKESSKPQCDLHFLSNFSHPRKFNLK